MDTYQAYVKTDEAKQITHLFPSKRSVEYAGTVSAPRDRVPDLDALKRERKLKVKTAGKTTVSIGRNDMDVSCVSQIVHPGQLSLIGDWLLCILRDAALRHKTLRAVCTLLEQRGIHSPLSRDIPMAPGDRVYVRRFEIAAAINRLRALAIR